MGSNLDQAQPRYVRHVSDAFPTLDALFAAGEEVQALQGSRGWGHILDVLEREIAAIDRRLDGASEPLTQAQYSAEHGRRSGLRGAQEAAQAILSRFVTALEDQRRRHEGDAESSPEERVTF